MATNAQSPLRAEAWSEAERLRDIGAVYTPPLLARWVADELLRLMGRPGSVWDIACGRGALLEAVHAANPNLPLVGFDLDAVAIRSARSGLPAGRFEVADSLAVHPDELRKLAGGQPRAIILNPPWGASLTVSRERLATAGFRTASGQFDSYDLFVERTLELLPRGGAFALIIPDSLLGVEHAQLRRILVEETELRLVARLGEGFFNAVYRGVMVVTGRKGCAPPKHAVRCFRLEPQARRAVIREQVVLQDIAENLTHAVPQARFSASESFRIELDVREDERKHLGRFLELERFVWRDHLSSSRGVELSKHGLVVRCPECATAAPQPRRPRLMTCSRCSTPFKSSLAPVEQIVDPGDATAKTGWLPLIAGEDVRRYTATPSRTIREGVPGIAYKHPSSYAGPKLLVRKTGVGISSAVDPTNALTTQVVFHYRPLRDRDSYLLHYLAGVLNSRYMLAYYLRTHGESEWRSHPYVTQQVIESLPVPALNGRNRSIARRIAAAARRRASVRNRTLENELRIETLVAELFGFDNSDWVWALDVLAGAQQLEAIRELNMPTQLTLPPR